jgi:predicted nucleotidyltransferase component of viral defense system
MNKTISEAAKILTDPEFFRSAVSFTAQRTGFAARLIEKDYFSSVLLEYLASASKDLVFKGGTCLAKVYAGFYRLSEDLDFVISMSTNAKRTDRSKQAGALKPVMANMAAQLPAFRMIKPLTGANNSTQYIAVAGYMSLISGRSETMKIEVGLREPLLTPAKTELANAILLNPVSDRTLINPISLRCISKMEAFAEKFRAALTRRDVAIRDFYDIDYASKKLDLHIDDDEFVRLVKQKLSVPGNPQVDVSQLRLEVLRQQLEGQLRPVLREKDYTDFDLERAIRTVIGMAGNL